MTFRFARTLGLLTAFALVGCGGGEPTETIDGGRPTPTAAFGTGSPLPLTDVPPQVIEPIFADAAAQTGFERDQFVIHRAQATTWTEPELACEEAGASPAGKLIEGYSVVLRIGQIAGTEHLLDYRVRADDNSFVLCQEAPLPSPT